jgi:hypothetical protein
MCDGKQIGMFGDLASICVETELDRGTGYFFHIVALAFVDPERSPALVWRFAGELTAQACAEMIAKATGVDVVASKKLREIGKLAASAGA